MGAPKKPLFPGWKMTVDQHHLLFRFWNSACRTQGWDKLPSAERDVKRKQVTAEVFGGEKSWTQINKTGECDLLFARLKFLADKLHGAREDQDPEPGQRRRYLHRIGELLMEFGDLMGGERAAAYLDKILRDRFKRCAGLNTIADLETEELQNAVMTLVGRLHVKKEEAEDLLAKTSHASQEILEEEAF